MAGRLAPAAPGGARLPGVLARERTLFVLALVVRVALIMLFLGPRGQRGGLELGTLADNIVAGKGFVWHFYGSEVPRASFFPPFYPALLALLKVLAASHWATALQLVQALVSALVPLAVHRLGARLVRADLAWIAAYAAAFWPPFLIYTAEVFPVTFHTLGVPLVLLLVVRAAAARGHPRRWRRAAILAGGGYGLLAYSLPSFVGSLVLMPLGLGLGGTGWRRSLAIPGLALASALVVMTPWTARNAAVHGRLVPMATNLGFNLLGANNPYAIPYANVLCAHDEIRWRVIDRRQLETMNEVDFDRLLLRRGLEYMLADPPATAGRLTRHVMYYWWASPHVLRYGRLEGLAWMALMTVTLPLALIGLAIAWRGRRRVPWGVALAACAWVTIFYMNFAVRGRYSLGIHPLLLILAAAGGGALVEGWRGRRAAGATGAPPAADRG